MIHRLVLVAVFMDVLFSLSEVLDGFLETFMKSAVQHNVPIPGKHLSLMHVVFRSFLTVLRALRF